MYHLSFKVCIMWWLVFFLLMPLLLLLFCLAYGRLRQNTWSPYYIPHEYLLRLYCMCIGHKHTWWLYAWYNVSLSTNTNSGHTHTNGPNKFWLMYFYFKLIRHIQYYCFSIWLIFLPLIQPSAITFERNVLITNMTVVTRTLCPKKRGKKRVRKGESEREKEKLIVNNNDSLWSKTILWLNAQSTKIHRTVIWNRYN